jgi:hypothetical protein
MRGFLHRIAASVVRPQPSVHPFVESIYPAARLQNSAEPPPPQSSPIDVAQASIPQPQPARARTQPPASMNEHGPLQLLLPRQGAETNSAVMRSTPRSEQPESNTPSASPQPQVVLSRQDHPADNSPSALEFVPIVVDHFLRTDIPDAGKLPVLRAPGEAQAISARGNARRQPAQVPSNSRAPQPQSDDIQIHIGRIEVVAVAQPAPRPAAAPVRKGLGLDEYLSRGNGRAR